MPEIIQNIQGKLQENQRKSFKSLQENCHWMEKKPWIYFYLGTYIPKICKSINPKFGLFVGSFVFAKKSM